MAKVKNKVDTVIFKNQEKIIYNDDENFYDNFVKNGHKILKTRKEKKFYSSSLACKLFRCDNIYIGVCKLLTDSKNKHEFEKTNEMFFNFVSNYKETKRYYFRLNYTKKDDVFHKDNFCFDYVDFCFVDKNIDLLYQNKTASDYHIYINSLGKTSGYKTEQEIIDDFAKHIEILKLKISISNINKNVSFCFDKINDFLLASKVIIKNQNLAVPFRSVEIPKEQLPNMRILNFKQIN